MKTYKILLIILTVLIGLSLFIILNLPKYKVPPIKKVKPVTPITQPVQKEILTYKGIDSVLNSFTKIPFEKLDQEYLNFSGYELGSFKVDMKYRIFYKIESCDLLKNLVGKFTVIDFMPEDSRLRKMNSIGINATQYLCIDKYILHRFLDLILALEKKGYDKYAFTINDGFRYPHFNKFKDGATFSQHIYGRAIDLAIGDINKDGKFDEATDKKIVLFIVENNIIKNTGGVGRYPYTNVVHFDTRGCYKRWDYQ